MELSIDPETAERIAWGACGVLSFIALIVWCRWRGTPEDQREVTPPELPKRERPSTPLNTNVIGNRLYEAKHEELDLIVADIRHETARLEKIRSEIKRIKQHFGV